MKAHKFGGVTWTQLKLNCVEDYSKAWAKIMAPLPWATTRYIDAFSGTGSYSPKIRNSLSKSNDQIFSEFNDPIEEKEQLQKGSARLAIDLEPKFDRIDLIELKETYANQLRKLAGDELGQRVFVHEKDANHALADLANNFTRQDRALVFIDPYGCEVWWETLEKIARTKVADVWYLFPTMGVNRQLEGDPSKIPQYKQDALDRVLGTPEWRTAFYKQSIKTDLFGEQEITERHAGPNVVEAFFIERLKTIFPAVHENCLQLRNSKNGHLFSLCFAVSNPSVKAQKLAMKIAGHTIKRWEKKQ